MSAITQITDYESRLVSLLLGQFGTGANWLSFFTAIAGAGKSLQNVEYAAYNLWQQRSNIDLATGAQLDQWGAAIGLPRAGWTDATYRLRLRVWLQVLRSKGTPDELILIVSDLTGQPIADVLLWETPPASYSLQFPGNLYVTDSTLALDTARYVAKADPAGVGIGQIVALAGPPLLFGVAGSGFSQGKFSVDVSTEAGV